jgi:hypothetical protein
MSKPLPVQRDQDSFNQDQTHPPVSIRPVGRPKVIPSSYSDRLCDLVRQGPRAHGYPFRNWTANWLSHHLAKETGIVVSQRHISRLLKQMGLSTRPTSVKPGSATRITVSDLSPARFVDNNRSS